MNTQQTPGAPPIDPMEITWIALVKARWKILGIAGLGAVAGLVIGLAQPNVYTSTGKFRVDAGQLASVVDASLGFGGVNTSGPGLRATREEVVDELEILYDQRIYQSVLDEVGLEAILRPPDPFAFDNEWTSVPIRMMHGFQALLVGMIHSPPKGSELERENTAMIALFSRTFVSPIRGSNVITVSHTSPHPDVARSVVRAYMKAGEVRHVQVFAQDPRDLEDLRELGTVLRDQLVQEEGSFQAHKLECGFQDLVQSRGFLTGRITVLQDEENRAKADLGELEAKNVAALAVIENQPRFIQQSVRDWVDNPDWVAANDVFINLQRAVTEMDMAAVGLGARNPDDPAYKKELTALHSRRDHAKAQRDAMDPKVLGPETMRQQPNLAFLAAERTVVEYPGLKAAVGTRIVSAQAQGKQAGEDLAAAHRCGSAHENFERVIAGLKGEILKNIEEFAVAGRRTQNEQRGKTSLRRISDPFLPLVKDGPDRAKSILIGLFLGLFGASGLAVLLEVLNRKLRRPVEVERLLGVRVLVAMPECKGWADRGRAERVGMAGEPASEQAADTKTRTKKAEVSA